MSQSNACAHCKLRAKYDARLKSFAGRFWKWHTRWCPGWKAYLGSLPEDEREAMLDRYR